MSVSKSMDRVSARVPPQVYRKLAQAAELMGATLNQFLVQSALEKAESVLDREQQIHLSERDALIFFEALENPPLPNAKLRKALKSYRETFPDAEI